MSANNFLRGCGVKDEPSSVELATQVMMSPETFMGNDIPKYLGLLQLLASQWYVLSQQKSLVREMKKRKWLLGIRTIRENFNSPDTIGKEEVVLNQPLEYSLASAQEICLIDDTVILKIFQPLS